MSNLAVSSFITVDDYLAGEAESPIKHEYVDGEVFAMGGATDAHVTISLNLASSLRAHLRGGPCRVYITDMKLQVERANAFFYPDVFVTCAAADAPEPLIKRSPSVVIEILSKSTEGYDRGDKFARYRLLDSLQDYVLIDSRRRVIDVFRRHADGWLLQPLAEDDRLELPTLDFGCTMDEIYEDVTLEPVIDEPDGEPITKVV
ncbi:Uma2 family endonuclease [Lamprobacter modestohalophilus]|uniref:Uma2 family endonuclease n=1 Tax=Lamprobacter modestohalophilus TaxID=1064514 RepID=UPI002ADEA8C1|nr:Uma2 family endonuclease [Lamprobacter modestohalophilus]MEA1048452.1 Uma2 family endonuclease [Lamprobacter modestohalophilus]